MVRRMDTKKEHAQTLLTIIGSRFKLTYIGFGVEEGGLII